MDSQAVALLEDDALEKGSVELELENLSSSTTLARFSWSEYVCFYVLGIGMMWTWNAVVAAAPYFDIRLSMNAWILQHAESALFATFATGLLGSTCFLVTRRKNANYTFRIYSSLFIYAAVSTILAFSTVFWTGAEPWSYFGFLLCTAGFVGLGNGLSQNGAYSFVAGFGQPGYTQAILLGCATSGIIPPMIQIALVVYNTNELNITRSSTDLLKVPRAWPFALFSVCTIVALTVLCALTYLIQRRRKTECTSLHGGAASLFSGNWDDDNAPLTHAKFFKESYYQALAIFLCFIVTTCSPVFSSKVESVHDDANPNWRNQQLIFVPLAYLIWQVSDFVGSFFPLVPLAFINSPRVLFWVSAARFGFLPIYHLCNIDGQGAIIGSDLFYLICVQCLSGLTNGWISIACMTSSSLWPDQNRREQAGSFMSFYLIAGLALGSLLSFVVA